VSLGFRSLIITGIKEIQIALPTVNQSCESNKNGSLPIAKIAVKVVARRERK
jgi:hypothetical protein